MAVAALGAIASQQTDALAAGPTLAQFTISDTHLDAASTDAERDALRREREVALAGRERAVSRDSRREALVDDKAARLQEAAESRAQDRTRALAAVTRSAKHYAAAVEAQAWQLPVSRYRLTSRFGECSSLWSSCHTGLDFAAPTGTPIYAVAAGRVTESGYEGSYGNKTVVTLADGSELWYCHQNSLTVTVGTQVMPGDLIGYIGSTGNTTGPHLHLEVHPGAGDAVDPIGAALAHGLRF